MFSNPGVDLLSLYGTSASPIDLSTSTSWYQDPNWGLQLETTSTPRSSGTFPSLQFDSWITIGAETSADGNVNTVGLDLASFEAGDDLTSDEVAGGSWLAIPGDVIGTSPDANGRVLIAQLTTDGTVVLDCNIQYREPNGSTPVATELSLVFQNGCPEDIDGSGMVDIFDILAVLTNFGCSGSCVGDLNEDGVVNMADGLLVISAFTNLCN